MAYEGSLRACDMLSIDKRRILALGDWDSSSFRLSFDSGRRGMQPYYSSKRGAAIHYLELFVYVIHHMTLLLYTKDGFGRALPGFSFIVGGEPMHRLSCR